MRKIYLATSAVLSTLIIFQNTNAQGAFQYAYSGKSAYNSNVRSVEVNHSSSTKYTPYPNPSVKGVNIQFATYTSGDYEVQLVNGNGHKVFGQKYALNKNNSIKIEWPQKPMPGIYYLKVKDLNTSIEETSRLQVM